MQRNAKSFTGWRNMQEDAKTAINGLLISTIPVVFYSAMRQLICRLIRRKLIPQEDGMMIILRQAVSYRRVLNSVTIITALPLIQFLFLWKNAILSCNRILAACPDIHTPRLLHKHGDIFVAAGWHPVNGHEIQLLKPRFSRLVQQICPYSRQYGALTIIWACMNFWE